MHTTLSRSAHADQLMAVLLDARCCDAPARCPSCQAKGREIRAARRDAIIHSVSTRRHRRYVS